jgi:Flp pilus assembly protein TadD
LAILPSDNLTGDATLNWVSRASQVVLSQQIKSSANLNPLMTPALRDAYTQNATLFLHSTYVRGNGSGHANQLHFEYQLEDAVSHKIVRTVSGDGSVAAALNEIARQLEPKAIPFSSSNEQAIEAWGRGDAEKAVELDPDFGEAWLGVLEKIAATGNAEETNRLAERALARQGLKPADIRPRIQFVAATARKDPNAKAEALQSIVKQDKPDPAALHALSNLQLAARQFPEAVKTLQRQLELQPNDPTILNSLGYAQAMAGDPEAAAKTLAEYGKLPGQATNALDSAGETYFMNGRFKEAEQKFLDAYKADPNFLGGTTRMKAAFARWLGGDLAGADAIQASFVTARPNGAPNAAWSQAVWLYSTQRKDAAMRKLAEAEADPTGKALAERQRKFWTGEVRLPEDLAQLKTLYDSTEPPNDGLQRVLYASALLKAGKREEAKALLARWPLLELRGDAQLQSLVFPMYLDLRKSLGMK